MAWVGTESLPAFYFDSFKTIHIILAFSFGHVPRPCSAVCNTNCPFSCPPERRENPACNGINPIRTAQELAGLSTSL